MLYHIITMTSQWVQWRLKSTGSWLFTQPFIQALIKDNNIKALRHWPLSGESGLAVFQQIFTCPVGQTDGTFTCQNSGLTCPNEF